MFGKLFASTFDGSLFGSGPVRFAVWAYVVANAQPPGVVEIRPKRLASIIGCPIDDIIEALDFLCAPDPESRNPKNNGIRLIHEGSYVYRLTNFEVYRSIKNNNDLKAYFAQAQRRHREKKNQLLEEKCQSVKSEFNQCQNKPSTDLLKSTYLQSTEVQSTERGTGIATKNVMVPSLNGLSTIYGGGVTEVTAVGHNSPLPLEAVEKTEINGATPASPPSSRNALKPKKGRRDHQGGKPKKKHWRDDFGQFQPSVLEHYEKVVTAWEKRREDLIHEAESSGKKPFVAQLLKGPGAKEFLARVQDGCDSQALLGSFALYAKACHDEGQGGLPGLPVFFGPDDGNHKAQWAIHYEKACKILEVRRNGKLDQP
jgi:hypothetical protein